MHLTQRHPDRHEVVRGQAGGEHPGEHRFAGTWLAEHEQRSRERGSRGEVADQELVEVVTGLVPVPPAFLVRLVRGVGLADPEPWREVGGAERGYPERAGHFAAGHHRKIQLGPVGAGEAVAAGVGGVAGGASGQRVLEPRQAGPHLRSGFRVLAQVDPEADLRKVHGQLPQQFRVAAAGRSGQRFKPRLGVRPVAVGHAVPDRESADELDQVRAHFLVELLHDGKVDVVAVMGQRNRRFGREQAAQQVRGGRAPRDRQLLRRGQLKLDGAEGKSGLRQRLEERHDHDHRVGGLEALGAVVAGQAAAPFRRLPDQLVREADELGLGVEQAQHPGHGAGQAEQQAAGHRVEGLDDLALAAAE
ncbi:hypothetical protein SAMN05421812_10876 [Asanoa hainanensis]|uniref:Uncharacterized protein n=1 Tax=Asanoa hainanensis TaxID=560556 RepID=A0A239NCN0_9ACTN|nr:hypothetical protein SAMN05421812_10876 [Asanoa hainanensis]